MNKKPVIMATCCLAGSLLVATPVYASATAGVTNVVALAEQKDTETPVAGISFDLAKSLSENTVEQSSSVENVTSDDKKVSAAAKKASEYDSLAVAQVNDYVNIRSKADADSEVVGKLYSDSVATVVKKVGKWYKIKSGSVTGYVKGEYVVVGDEKLAKSVSTQVATVNTETLNVRDEASKKADVVALAADGQKLKVTSLKKADDGWVKVKTAGKSGYVSSDYVEVTREYTYAISKEEEEAKLAAEKAAKEAEEAAKAAREEAAAAQETSTASQDTAEVASTSTPAQTSASTSAPASTSTPAQQAAPAQQQTAPVSTSTPAQQTAPAQQQAEPAQQTAPAQEAAPAQQSSESQGSTKGQEVANYACQFIGNPYVWGGTSLTNGADCSGFVMSVYAHFGVSLPHSSYAMEGCGRAVSTSEMQPGDIICYGSHVAIYIGNNTIVHASNPETGIKTSSPANYRTIVTVRRIF